MTYLASEENNAGKRIVCLIGLNFLYKSSHTPICAESWRCHKDNKKLDELP